MAILVLFGMLVFKVDWGQSVPALALMLVTFGLASVAIGTALGTFVKTESQASNLSIALGMVMALLGGCWYPIELFPPVAQTVARGLPTFYAMQGLTDLSLRGGGLPDITPYAVALVGFAAVFFVIGVARFRYE
jgi:ABC-2 type transport system permease protein